MSRSSIVVVDDDPATLEMVGTVLDHAGWVVHRAASGSEALHLVARRAAPYVLTDIQMPGMTGIDLAERLRVSHPDVRLAAMTAYPDDIARAIAAGSFEGVIEKPIDVDALPAQIDWLFFRRRLI